MVYYVIERIHTQYHRFSISAGYQTMLKSNIQKASHLQWLSLTYKTVQAAVKHM